MPSSTRCLVGLMASGLLVAGCTGSGGTGVATDETGTDATGDAIVTSDTGRDTRVDTSADTVDTSVAPPDSTSSTDTTVADDGVAPIDPACAEHFYEIDPLSHLSRGDALAVPFDYDIYVSGVRPEGNTSGSVEKQYLKLVVTTSRKVDVTFGGSNCYAAFYFESETTSRFSPDSSGQLLDVGTYYVEIGDTAPRYFGAGPSWEIYVHWSVPPPACADAGTSD